MLAGGTKCLPDLSSCFLMLLDDDNVPLVVDDDDETSVFFSFPTFIIFSFLYRIWLPR